jgi:hypothetical protein
LPEAAHSNASLPQFWLPSKLQAAALAAALYHRDLVLRQPVQAVDDLVDQVIGGGDALDISSSFDGQRSDADAALAHTEDSAFIKRQHDVSLAPGLCQDLGIR